LTQWAKLLGLFVGAPLVCLLSILTILGIREYSDIHSKLDEARGEVEHLQTQAQRLKSEATTLEDQLRGTRTRLARLSELEAEVSFLRSDLRDVQEYLKLEPSEYLTEGRERLLEYEAEAFASFLQGIGIELPNVPSVAICGESDLDCSLDNAYYSPEKNQIIIGDTIADDRDAFLYNYAQYAITAHWPPLKDLSANPHVYAVVSGTSDYLVCSYTGDPRVGEIASQRLHLPKPFFRDLETEAGFRNLLEPIGTGGIWAAVLWRLRARVGPTESDHLAVAWAGQVAGSSKLESNRAHMAAALEAEAQHIGDNVAAVVRRELVARDVDADPGN
jgi:hypothetical protein